MELALGNVFYWLLFASAFAITLAFGIHWAVDKWLGDGESDQPFFWALGFGACSIGLLLLRYMPS